MTQFSTRRAAAALMALAIGGCAAHPPVAGMAPVATAGTPAPAAAPPAAELVSVPVQGRPLPISVYRPAAAARGVLFLSHGGGSAPDALSGLIARLRDAGFAVVAPLHRDSVRYPEDERDDLRAAFASRIADLQATSALAERLFPGLPYGGVGFSYGSLTALIGGGALRGLVDARVPAMKAVAAFSSPGLIPGVVTDEGLASIAVPTLMITGSADTVPGFVADPAQHRRYYEAQPAGDRYLVTVEGATHTFVVGKEPGADAAMAILVNFLEAHVLDDAEARRSLETARPDPPVALSRR